MALKVIGAGLPRTGTKSLKLALEKLGLTPCYHMVDLYESYPHHIEQWQAASQGKPVDWSTMFTDFQAAVDYPVSRYYQPILQHYPQAKVILTVRPVEKWYTSFAKTIYPSVMQTVAALQRTDTSTISVRAHQQMRIDQLFHDDMLQKDFAGKFETDQAAVQDVFHQHNAQVKQTVPSNQLLVYELGDGWEPLCQFLGVPIPAEDFPHTNTTSQFNAAFGSDK